MGDATDQVWITPEFNRSSNGNVDNTTRQTNVSFARQCNRKSSVYKIIPYRNAYSYYYADSFVPCGIKSSDGSYASQMISHQDIMQCERVPISHENKKSGELNLKDIIESKPASKGQECRLSGVSSHSNLIQQHIAVRASDVADVHGASTFYQDYDNLSKDHSPIKARHVPQKTEKQSWMVTQERLWLYQCPSRYGQSHFNKDKIHPVPITLPVPLELFDVSYSYQNRIRWLTSLEHIFKNGNNLYNKKRQTGLPQITSAVTGPPQQHAQNQNAGLSTCKHYCPAIQKVKRFRLLFPLPFRKRFRINCLKVIIFHSL